GEQGEGEGAEEPGQSQAGRLAHADRPRPGGRAGLHRQPATDRAARIGQRRDEVDGALGTHLAGRGTLPHQPEGGEEQAAQAGAEPGADGGHACAHDVALLDSAIAVRLVSRTSSSRPKTTRLSALRSLSPSRTGVPAGTRLRMVLVVPPAPAPPLAATGLTTVVVIVVLVWLRGLVAGGLAVGGRGRVR